MSKASRFLSGAVASAMLVSAMPAGAAALPGAAKVAKTDTSHQWGGGWNRRRHRNDIDVGDVLTGVLILGTIATVMDAATKSTRRDRDRNDRYPDNRRYPDDNRYPDRNSYPDDSRNSDDGYGAGDEDQAINDCATAAENQASGRNVVAQVRSVNDVRSTSNGYEVRGTLDTRINYRSGVSASRDFRCDWRNGRVTNVDLI